MDFEKLCAERYSLRKYADRPVEAEKLEKVLEAGHNAPTAHNLQPQRILVMQSREALEKAEECTACKFHAPVILVVAYDPNKSLHLREQLVKLLLAEHADIAGSETEICRLKHHLCRRDRCVDLAVVLTVALTRPGALRVICHGEDDRRMEVAVHAGIRLLQRLRAQQQRADHQRQRGSHSKNSVSYLHLSLHALSFVLYGFT